MSGHLLFLGAVLKYEAVIKTLFMNVVSRGILFPHWYSDYVISHDNINKFPGTWINLYFESSVSFLGFWSRFRTSRTQMSLTEPGLWPKVCLKLKKTKWTPQQLLGCRGETLGKFGRCTERTQMGRAPCCFWLEFRPSKIEVIWFSLSLYIYILHIDFLEVQSSQPTTRFLGMDLDVFWELI